MPKSTAESNVSDVQVLDHGCGGGIRPQQQACANVDSINLGDRPNVPETPIAATDGAIAMLPVVLADLSVQFFVNAMIDLPEPALEINTIDKRLKVTQCMLLQPTNVLFIKGYVRKNMSYTTRSCSNLDGTCGDIRHCTIDVPFEFTTPVTFYRNPDIIVNNTQDEFRYFREEGLPAEQFAQKDRLLSSDLSEYNQVSSEYYNKLPFCDILSSNITEFDEYINQTRPDNIVLPFEEILFDVVEEKMVIELRLRIYQEQQIAVPAGGCV